MILRRHGHCMYSEYNHFLPRYGARRQVMKKLIVFVALFSFATTLIGCHASASVDKTETSIAAPR